MALSPVDAARHCAGPRPAVSLRWQSTSIAPRYSDNHSQGTVRRIVRGAERPASAFTSRLAAKTAAMHHLAVSGSAAVRQPASLQQWQVAALESTLAVWRRAHRAGPILKALKVVGSSFLCVAASSSSSSCSPSAECALLSAAIPCPVALGARCRRSEPSHPLLVQHVTFSLCFRSSHRNLRPAADNVD